MEKQKELLSDYGSLCVGDLQNRKNLKEKTRFMVNPGWNKGAQRDGHNYDRKAFMHCDY